MNNSDFALFFSTLYNADDIVEIRAIKPNRQSPAPRSKWHAAANWLGGVDYGWVESMNRDGWGIYAGVLPRTAAGVRSNANTLPGALLWADIDHVTPAEAGARLSKSCLPHPSVTVNSGHGVQCYWLLTAPQPPAVLQEANQDIAIHLGSDIVVKNPERVMRIPGFVNHKPPAADAELLECHADLRYDFADLRAKIPAAKLPAAPAAAMAIRSFAYSGRNVEKRAWGMIQTKHGSPEGGRNWATYKAAAVLTRDFALDDDTAMAMIMQWDAEKNTPPIANPKELGGIVVHSRLYGRNDMGCMLTEKRPASGLADKDDGFNVDAFIESVSAEPCDDGPARPPDPGPFPERLIKIPGFLGEFVEYATRRTVKPQPVLNLGAAIVALGTLAGRKVAGVTGLRTNFYVLGVAETGTGKNAPREILRQVLADSGEAKDGEFKAIDRLKTDAGIRAALATNPCVTFVLDEIGEFLETIKSSKNSAWIRNIIPELMMLYSQAGSPNVIMGGLGDATKNVTVDCPHVCLFGTSVPGSVFQSMTMHSVSGGFMGRLMLFESPHGNPRKQRPSLEPLPKSLIDVSDYWKRFRPEGKCLTGNHNGTVSSPLIVEESAQATAIYDKCEETARNEIEIYGNEWSGPYNRAEENARKLGVLYACSENPHSPFIGTAAAEWSAELSLYLTRRLIYLGSLNIADNEIHDRINKVLRYVIDAGEKGRTKKELIKRFWAFGARNLGETLDTLVGAEEIVAIEVKTKTKPKLVFKTNSSNSSKIVPMPIIDTT